MGQEVSGLPLQNSGTPFSYFIGLQIQYYATISAYLENGGYFPKWLTCILFSFNLDPGNKVLLQRCCRALKYLPFGILHNYV